MTEKNLAKSFDKSIEEKGKFGRFEKGHIVLPFDEKQFNNFIGSLLGSPQSISKMISGVFEVERDQIINIYMLLLQRITQQNAGVLANFRAKINFSDNSSIELNSIEELASYNEIRPIISRSIHLTLDFVVKFQDKEFPEKQRVQVSFYCGDIEIPLIDEIEGRKEFRTIISGRGKGFVQFRIEHTARTWGADIEALLSNYIETMKKPIENEIKEKVRKNKGKISLGFGVTFLSLSLYGIYQSINNIIQKQLIDTKQFIEGHAGNTMSEINEKTSFVITLLNDRQWLLYEFEVVVFVIISCIIAFVLSIYLYEAADQEERSFLLLTKESEKEKTKIEAKLKQKWKVFIGTFVLGIIGGIISNYFFLILIR